MLDQPSVHYRRSTCTGPCRCGKAPGKHRVAYQAVIQHQIPCADCVRAHYGEAGTVFPSSSLPTGLWLCCDGDRRCYVHVGAYRDAARLCRCESESGVGESPIGAYVAEVSRRAPRQSGWSIAAISGGSGTITHGVIARAPGCPEGRHPTRDCACKVFRTSDDAFVYILEREGLAVVQ